MALEFYPAALQAFPNQKHKAAFVVLAAAPIPTAGRALTRRRLVGLLHRAGRRNDEDLVNQILADLRAPALTQPPEVENALGHAVTGLLGIVAAMHTAVESLEKEFGRVFDEHPLAPILTSVPGLGTLSSARILAEIGDDTARFTSPAGLRAFVGTAPTTSASGRSHYVNARKVRNKRLGDGCHWWAFSMLTKSAGVRAHYDKRRALGERHNAALRNLANKLLGRPWWCLQRNEPWDDSIVWASPSATESTSASVAA